MRLWHGEVALEKADAYQQFMIERAAPDYSLIEGLINLSFTRKDDVDRSHFLLVTQWDGMESIRKFAGEQPELAKYYLEDDDFLLEKEKYVDMYETFYQKEYQND